MLEPLSAIYEFYHNNPKLIKEYLEVNVENDMLPCDSGFPDIHELIIYHLEYSADFDNFYHNVLENI